MNPLRHWWATAPRVTRALVAALVGLYALYLVVSLVGGVGETLFDALALVPARVARQPWSVFTHTLVVPAHGWAVLTVVIGAMFVNVLGRDAETMLGPRWLALAWSAATLGAALATLAVFAGQDAAVFGPWPAVLGLMLALGVTFPDKAIGLMFVGPVRLVYVALGFAVLSMLLSGSVAAIVPDAGGLLGGAAVGFWTRRQRGAPAPARSARPSTPVFDPSEPLHTPTRAARRAAPAPLDVDTILEKISAKGLDSLTPEERRVLDEASRR